MDNTDIYIPESLIFHETTIPIPQQYEALYVPVKPICEIIQTNFKKQDNWLKQDEYFRQLYTLRYTTGADGKQYKMRCLPIIDVLTWVAAIGNDNKTEEQLTAKYDFMRWLRRQTMKLYKSMNKVLEENERELLLMQKIEEDEQAYDEKNEEARFYRDRINHNKKSLEETRTKRFLAQYELEFKPRLED